MSSMSLKDKDEDALYTAGRKYGNSNYRGNQKRGFHGRGTPRQYQRRLNFNDLHGNLTRCYECGSKFHYAKECPDAPENSHKVYEMSHKFDEMKENMCEEYDQEEDVYATNLDGAWGEICYLAETTNYAILDSACTSTVCGETWLKCFLDSMDKDNRKRIKEFESSTTFRFGNGNTLTSVKRVHIPLQRKQYTYKQML